MIKVIVMAGGTGGHVYPGIAVADILSAKGCKVEWFGTPDKIEAEVVPDAGYTIHFFSIEGVRGKGIKNYIKAPFVLLKTVVKARRTLKNVAPDLVIGMGGYASGPGAIAAKTLGIPIIIHEQNAIFGMTNRWLANIADRVLCGIDSRGLSIPDTNPQKTEFVGNPVREVFHPLVRTNNQSHILNILVIGGSLGALALNNEVPKALNCLANAHKVRVHHQTGKGKLRGVKQAYANTVKVELTEFIDDMAHQMGMADIVICRAGALTVAEIANMGKCAIFVPLPIAVDDHQTYNARSLSDCGAAILLPQEQLATELPVKLKELADDRQKIADISEKAKRRAQPDAANKVVSICLETIEAIK